MALEKEKGERITDLLKQIEEVKTSRDGEQQRCAKLQQQLENLEAAMVSWMAACKIPLAVFGALRPVARSAVLKRGSHSVLQQRWLQATEKANGATAASDAGKKLADLEAEKAELGAKLDAAEEKAGLLSADLSKLQEAVTGLEMEKSALHEAVEHKEKELAHAADQLQQVIAGTGRCSRWAALESPCYGLFLGGLGRGYTLPGFLCGIHGFPSLPDCSCRPWPVPRSSRRPLPGSSRLRPARLPSASRSCMAN